ncbi:MAG: conjugative transposon protein TraM [Paludibacteraceae bacterium]|nr:conjugative transposon protein TraM [Paludibacteraceae bacterium]
MADTSNKNRNLLMIGGFCAFVISCILFATFYGKDEEVAVEKANEYNATLPTAVVEDVTDDKFAAVEREQRRMAEEYDGSEGSSFDLLSYEDEEEKVTAPTDQAGQDLMAFNEENARRIEEEQQRLAETKAEYEREVRAKKSGSAGGSSSAVKTGKKSHLSAEEFEAEFERTYRKDKVEEVKEEPAPVQEVAQEPKTVEKRGFINPLQKSSTSSHDIRAVVHGEHRNLTTNSKVKLRLIDPMTIEGVTIPANRFVYATVSFSEGRIQLYVDNVNYNNQVLPFKGIIYDYDGSRGLHVPDNAISEAGQDAADASISESSRIPSTGSATGNAGLTVIRNTTTAIKTAVKKQNRIIKVSIDPNYKVLIREKK